MRIPSSFARTDISENMMTPMIDVVFNLLIFFVCASALSIHERILKTDLASSGSTPVQSAAAAVDPPDAPLDVVFVRLSRGAAGGTVMRLNDTDYQSFDELRNVLRELAGIAPESPVVLEIADDVEAGEMVRVYDTCRSAEFHTIQFATGGGSP